MTAYKSFTRCSMCFHNYFSRFVSPSEQCGHERCKHVAETYYASITAETSFESDARQ